MKPAKAARKPKPKETLIRIDEWVHYFESPHLGLSFVIEESSPGDEDGHDGRPVPPI